MLDSHFAPWEELNELQYSLHSRNNEMAVDAIFKVGSILTYSSAGELFQWLMAQLKKKKEISANVYTASPRLDR